MLPFKLHPYKTHHNLKSINNSQKKTPIGMKFYVLKIDLDVFFLQKFQRNPIINPEIMNFQSQLQKIVLTANPVLIKITPKINKLFKQLQTFSQQTKPN